MDIFLYPIGSLYINLRTILLIHPTQYNLDIFSGLN